MGNDKKKTPKITSRRRVTALARACVSTTKRKKATAVDQDGSFIEHLTKEFVSSVTASSFNASQQPVQANSVVSPN